jgi:RecG-like helicase
MGTQQSGVLNLQIADIVKDREILSLARHHALKKTIRCGYAATRTRFDACCLH